MKRVWERFLSSPLHVCFSSLSSLFPFLRLPMTGGGGGGVPNACLRTEGDREDVDQTDDGFKCVWGGGGTGLSDYRRACYGRDLNTLNLKEVFKAKICARELDQKRKRGTSPISPLDLLLNGSQSGFISNNAGIITFCSPCSFSSSLFLLLLLLLLFLFSSFVLILLILFQWITI